MGPTGFWHGADWNFILWGLWYFLLLSAEKLLLGAAFCIPQVVEGIKKLCRRHTWLRVAAALSVMLLYLAALAKSSYTPFLYFRF